MNRAAEIGPARFSWWKDWWGQAVAIVACGPSAKVADVEKLHGRLPVVAIKEAHLRLAPWCDVVYGCEFQWWKHVRGLPEFSGLKLAWSETSLDFPDVQRFRLRKRDVRQKSDHQFCNELLVDEPGEIGSGQNSGFQALNIAVQFGAARILLIGFDCGGSSAHFYGRNSWPKANNPDDSVFPIWASIFDRSASVLKKLGVEVVNASPVSRMKAFPVASVEETMKAWCL